MNLATATTLLSLLPFITPFSLSPHNRPHTSLSLSADKFSLTNLFSSPATPVKPRTPSTSLAPHPSSRPHINPLNTLYPPTRNQLEGVEGALPFHPQVKSGVLENGFSWVFLPNRSPGGRFEAHLQVFSGSGAWILLLLLLLLLHLYKYMLLLYIILTSSSSLSFSRRTPTPTRHSPPNRTRSLHGLPQTRTSLRHRLPNQRLHRLPPHRLLRRLSRHRPHSDGKRSRNAPHGTRCPMRRHGGTV